MTMMLRPTPITLAEAVELTRANRTGYPKYAGNYRHVERDFLQGQTAQLPSTGEAVEGLEDGCTEEGDDDADNVG